MNLDDCITRDHFLILLKLCLQTYNLIIMGNPQLRVMFFRKTDERPVEDTEVNLKIIPQCMPLLPFLRETSCVDRFTEWSWPEDAEASGPHPHPPCLLLLTWLCRYLWGLQDPSAVEESVTFPIQGERCVHFFLWVVLAGIYYFLF